ncbi:plasmid mobilization relaxosome protein MobC [Streptomyces sp. NPDC093085]|uniref:plasmid mobilization relaxosome protein MobC n=1 Tax=Streptomyces sp. NPDC093085 TaxID=3155068 RepID=UPI0034253F9C
MSRTTVLRPVVRTCPRPGGRGKPGWSPSEGARRPAGLPAPGGAGRGGRSRPPQRPRAAEPEHVPLPRAQAAPPQPQPDRAHPQDDHPPLRDRARRDRRRRSAAQRSVTVARFLAAVGLAAARGSTTLHTNEQLDAAIDELAALRTALSRIGNNINQIAYVYNAGGQPRPGELEHALTTLPRLLARIDDAADTLVKKRL